MKINQMMNRMRAQKQEQLEEEDDRVYFKKLYFDKMYDESITKSDIQQLWDEQSDDIMPSVKDEWFPVWIRLQADKFDIPEELMDPALYQLHKGEYLCGARVACAAY